MWPVCQKELRQFFSSLTGYIAIIVFLLVNGLMLFVFDDNIFEFGYATLDRFFQLAPWILLLLIPAITMRSFADEFRTGTYEILQTRPLARWQITGGKYLGCFLVAFVIRDWIWVLPSAPISGYFSWRPYLRPFVFAAAALPQTPWSLLSAD
jgi:ABC-2 type transport system permease protein